MPIFCDVASLGATEYTPVGGLRVHARPTRCGVLAYRREDGSTLRLWRPPHAVFDAASLASLLGAAVTVSHPKEFVTPATYGQLAKGVVVSVCDEPAEGQWVEATLDINDADTIARIGTELVELSAAYVTELDETPGVTPDGEAYDAVQRGPYLYNHVALLPPGGARAGRGAVLLLDSEEEIMHQFRDADDASAEKPVEEVFDAKAAYDGIAAALSDMTKRIDALEGAMKPKTEETAPKEVADSLSFEERLTARRALERAAEKTLTGYTDSLTSAEVLRLARKQLNCPHTATDDFVAGALHAASRATPPTVRVADATQDSHEARRRAYEARLEDQRAKAAAQ